MNRVEHSLTIDLIGWAVSRDMIYNTSWFCSREFLLFKSLQESFTRIKTLMDPKIH